MRLLLLVLLILLPFNCSVAITAARADDTNYCNMPGVAFASCKPFARRFRTVMLAIPGWNGTCSDSFGQADSNLLNVMRQTNFFDIDCFDYNSHDQPISVSRDLLRKRLLDLQALGYEQLALVTHSTGGVLALDLIQSEMLAPDGNSLRRGPDQSFLFDRHGLKLVGLYAFAAPINGVRDDICNAAMAGNFIGLTREVVVPLLCKDSFYLAGIKADFQRINGIVDALPSDQRPALGFSFDFRMFQAQGDDWVVNPIAEHESWFPDTANAQVVLTQMAHTKVVHENGTYTYPNFSGETMQDKGLLAFGLLPRTQEFFVPTLVASQDLDQVQRGIVGGVVDYASFTNLFANSQDQVSDFVVLLLNSRFVRAPDFDAFAVDSFSTLLQTKKNSGSDAGLVEFGDNLLTDVDRGYLPASQSDPLVFSGQSGTAARKLVAVLRDIFNTITQRVQQDQSLAVHLRDDNGSLDQFQQHIENVLPRLLASNDDGTQNLAVALANDFAVNGTATTLARSNVVSTLAQFSAQHFTILNADRKTNLANVLTALSNRSDTLNQQIVTEFQKPIHWQGNEAPLWAPMINDQQMKVFVEKSDSSDASLKFLSGVVANGGRYFVSAETAKSAADKFHALNGSTFNTQLLVQGANLSAFPSVRDHVTVMLNQDSNM